MRDTFMKVAQSLIVKKQLVNEKSIKEKMIHSVMPPKVADWLMNEGHAEGIDDAMFPADGGKNGTGPPNQNANGAGNATAGGPKSGGDGKKSAKAAKEGAEGGDVSGEDDDDLFELSEEDSESGYSYCLNLSFLIELHTWKKKNVFFFFLLGIS